MDHYDQLDSKAEILFNALDSLSTVRLNHHVISASDESEPIPYDPAEFKPNEMGE